ncbi:hypothetical protein GCM10020366_38790 [Saccharopolyspora gregorii]|uniref:Tetratricopeptide repeat protein n=1 Tax=Saccharopolyspora gregorii TaxID=33914 RepID=A0ABP6RTI6_9PSEU
MMDARANVFEVDQGLRVGTVPPEAAGYVPMVAVDEPGLLAAGTTLFHGDGFGKTATIVDQVERAWLTGKVDLLVWAEAGSRESILSTYAMAAARLGLRSGRGPERDAVRFLEHLAASTCRWVVVLHDIASPEVLEGLVPPAGGRVLATSRIGPDRIAEVLPDVTAIELPGPIDPERHLTARGAGGTSDDMSAVSRTWGDDPLALAMIAAYLRQDPIGHQEYFERFQAEGGSPSAFPARSALALASRTNPLASRLADLLSASDDHGVPVELLTSSPVLRHLRQDSEVDPSPNDVSAALRVLRDLELLTERGDIIRCHRATRRVRWEDLPEAERGPVVTTIADGLVEIVADADAAGHRMFRANIAFLLGLGDHLIQPEVHDAVGEVVQSLGDHGLGAAQADFLHRMATRCTDLRGPDDLSAKLLRTMADAERDRDPEATRAALESALTAANIEPGPDHDQTVECREALLDVLDGLGAAAAAVEVAAHARDSRSRRLGPGHPDTVAASLDVARRRHELGDAAAAQGEWDALLSERAPESDEPAATGIQVHRHRIGVLTHGDPDRARAELSELITRAEAAPGTEHPVTADCREELACVPGGDPAANLELLTRVVVDRTRALGHSAPDTLRARLHAARLRSVFDTTGALVELEGLLPVLRRTLGTAHADSVFAAQEIAGLRCTSGDHAGGLAAQQELVRKLERECGAEHHQTFAARDHAAYLRGWCGDPVGGQQELDQLAFDLTRTVGPADVQTVHVERKAAVRLGENGDPHAAADRLSALAERLAAEADWAGEASFELRAELAWWQSAAGRYEDAVRTSAALLDDVRAAYGEHDPRRTPYHLSLAQFRGWGGDPAAAAAEYRRVRDAQLAFQAADHPDVLSTRYALVDWTGWAGDAAGAVELAEELAVDCGRALDADDPTKLVVDGALATWRRANGDAVGAAEQYAALAVDHARVHGPIASSTIWAADSAAQSWAAAGDFAAARRTYDELMIRLSSIAGPDHPETVDVRHRRVICGAAADPAAAVADLKLLVQDATRVLGAAHPDTLRVRRDLAEMRAAAGNPYRAMIEFDRLAVDRVDAFGPDHPDLDEPAPGTRGTPGSAAASAATLDGIAAALEVEFGPGNSAAMIARGVAAEWHGLAGDPAGAESALLELTAVAEEALGAHHRDVLRLLERLACWHVRNGNHAAAADVHRRVLGSKGRISFPDPNEIEHHCLSIAINLDAAGDRAEAVKAFEDWAQRSTVLFGATDLRVLDAWSVVVEHRGNSGDVAGAASLAAARGIAVGPYPRPCPRTAQELAAHERLAYWCARGGEAAAAAQLYRETALGWAATAGPDDPDALRTRELAALSLGDSGDAAGAAALLDWVLADHERVYGARHPVTEAVRERRMLRAG